MIDPMIPGSAAAALPASLPRSRARAFNLFLTHSLSLLGFFGGVEEPPLAAPPVRAVTIVEMIRPIEVKTAVIVKPCSLRISLSFSFEGSDLRRGFFRLSDLILAELRRQSSLRF